LRCSEESDGVSQFIIGQFRNRAQTHMFMALSRFTPAAVKESSRRADLGGSCGRWIIQRTDERLQRLASVVPGPECQRTKVARQRPADRLPTWRTFLCACSWTSTAARHFDFIPLICLACMIDTPSDPEYRQRRTARLAGYAGQAAFPSGTLHRDTSILIRGSEVSR
jgi:hypothetical protein